MTSRTIPSGFLKNIAQNGIGRYVCQLQRLTFKFDKKGVTSRGTRDFVEDYLMDFTKANPNIVIYLKLGHQTPELHCDYLNGYKTVLPLGKMGKDEICKWVNLAKSSKGELPIRMRKRWHTDTPSIQGVWHPFTFKDPVLSTAELKDPKLYKYVPPEMSSTEKLLELYKQNLISTDEGKDK